MAIKGKVINNRSGNWKGKKGKKVGSGIGREINLRQRKRLTLVEVS